MGYLTRGPDSSNDIPRSREGESPWLECTEFDDETSLLLQEAARRCAKCDRATRNHHLDPDELCPDCR